MPHLFPVIALPLPIERRPKVQQGSAFRPAPLWDFLAGDVVRDPSGHVVLTDGYTAWTQWVQKVCLVKRREARIYDQLFGHRIERLLGERNRSLVQAEAQRTLTAALKRDPRTRDVVSFGFVWPALNTVHVTFTALPATSATTGAALRGRPFTTGQSFGG